MPIGHGPGTVYIRPMLASSLSPFTAAGFRALVPGRLHAVPAGIVSAESPAPSPSDYDLDPALLPSTLPPATAAAVLVPVVARPDLTVLLTQRTEHLPSHPGQIAFPGGKVDPVDGGPLGAALREAEEEIGLDRALVEPLGYLDTYRTRTGFSVVPVVALVDPVFTLRLNPGEVAEAFEVPLSFLMDAANHRRDTRFWKGADRTYHAMPYGERYIWGATAGMLKNMHARLFGP